MTRMMHRSLVAILAVATSVLAQSRTDNDGNPLPDGALARFGSYRFRISSSESINTWAVSPDGKTLAVADCSGITLWDTDSGRPGVRVASPWFEIESVSFSPDGKNLVHVDRWGVTLRDAASGRKRGAWDVREAAPGGPFLPDASRFVVTGKNTAHAHLFDCKEPAYVRVCDADEPVVVASPSGRYFLGESDSVLHLVDGQTGRVRCRFTMAPEFQTIRGVAHPSNQICALSP